MTLLEELLYRYSVGKKYKKLLINLTPEDFLQKTDNVSKTTVILSKIFNAVHVTKEGFVIPIKYLTDDHLIKLINYKISYLIKVHLNNDNDIDMLRSIDILVKEVEYRQLILDSIVYKLTDLLLEEYTQFFINDLY